MKKIISIAMIVSLIVVFSACESKTGKTTGENNESVSIMENGTGELNLSMTEKDLTVKVKNNVIDENNKVALNIDSQADFYKVYENVEELINSDATTIVFGEITDLNYTNLEQGIYTNLSVTIKESLKGDLKADDIISVFENGGISTYKDYMEDYGDELVTKDFLSNVEKPKDDELVISHFDGTEFSKKGQQVVLFLVKSEGGIIPKGAYECVGTYMGKLTLEEDQFVRTKSDNNNGSFYTDKEDDLKKSKLLSRVRKNK